MTDSPELRTEKNRITHPEPFLWLLQVRVPTVPETMLRLTPNPKGLNWGNAGDGSPLYWHPFPATLGEITSDSEGGLPSVSVTVGGITREITALLVQHRYLLDQEVKMHLVHRAYLSNPTVRRTFVFEVLGTSTDEEKVTFTLSTRNLYKFTIPSRRILSTCGNTYRDKRCRFTGDPGDVDLGPCRKQFADCLARRAWEIGNGYEAIHPGPFKGGKGIPRRGAR